MPCEAQALLIFCMFTVQQGNCSLVGRPRPAGAGALEDFYWDNSVNSTAASVGSTAK